MNNYPTRFCINCNFFDLRSQLCENPSSIKHVNPVSGKTLYETATIMRANQEMCGMDATLFLPIDVAIKPTILQRIRNAIK